MRTIFVLAFVLATVASCDKDDDGAQSSDRLELSGRYAGAIPSTTARAEDGIEVSIDFNLLTLAPGGSDRVSFNFGDCPAPRCRGQIEGSANMQLDSDGAVRLTCTSCINTNDAFRDYAMSATGTASRDTIRLDVTGEWPFGKVVLVKQ